MGGSELTLFHGSLRVTLTVAYRAGDGGAMLFHQTGWDPVRNKGCAHTAEPCVKADGAQDSECVPTGTAIHGKGSVCVTAASLTATVHIRLL